MLFPNIEPPLVADCCVGEPNKQPPVSGGLVVAAAAAKIEPEVFAVALAANGLVDVEPPPNIEPPVELLKLLQDPPPNILPPEAAGGLVFAAAAANRPVAGGCVPVLAPPKTDCSGLGMPPKILPADCGEVAVAAAPKMEPVPGVAAAFAAGAVEPNNEGADEPTAAPPPNSDVVVLVTAAVEVGPKTEVPPPNILPPGEVVVDEAVVVVTVVAEDSDREPNKEPAVEVELVVVAAKGNEDAAVAAAGTAAVDVAELTILADVVAAVVAVILVLSVAVDVTVLVVTALPNMLSAEEAGVLAAAVNENSVLGVVVVVEVALLKNTVAASPVPLADAKENDPGVRLGVDVANPENIFPDLVESPGGLGVGLHMLSVPNKLSVGTLAAPGVGVLHEVGAAAAGFGSGRPDEVIVTFGAAVTLLVTKLEAAVELLKKKKYLKQNK